jgi:GLPGLI family protein
MITPKTCLSLLAILFAFTSFSQQQELFVRYSVECKTLYQGKYMELRATNKESLCDIIRITRMVYTENGNKFYENKESHRYFYKDYNTNCITGSYNHRGTHFIVKEEMNMMKWRFFSKNEEILNYSCQMAETEFRGRTYQVWFTRELPFKASPWKFHGIPGVVLKARSTDEVFLLEATSLKIQEPKKPLTNPYKADKSISWEEFVRIYKEKSESFIKKWEANSVRYSGNTSKMHDPRLEIIMPWNNTFGGRK